MSLRGTLQLVVGIGAWAGAIVAAVFGMWIPLIALLAISGVVVGVFAGPSIWKRLSKGQG